MQPVLRVSEGAGPISFSGCKNMSDYAEHEYSTKI